ncbi:HD domain-containing protein [Endozoicomonas sp. SM1973]|uniref:HD domain-containing protein n=1 Tax=Spartinivicinus marinus TaxID=2994442 RepID=A0A853IH45_9GAMM|nr:HD domain-containing phosphohydrolase [Spartinivicinus marinus]MCX4026263.1 HD domain-containing protein [Spartinivicinus marinus]NYZ68465.1 HD domain-containing protein [Spartinivicinus marinus]
MGKGTKLKFKVAKVEEAQSESKLKPWKILLVDDDEDVHIATKIALGGLVYKQRSLLFISAYTAEEAKKKVEEHPDIALAFVDVVMETESAGLDFVEWLRKVHQTKDIRVVLRTGQPGQAPEKNIVLDYGINDYKDKSELTAERLLTSTITGLRGYDDIMAIKKLLAIMDWNQKAIVYAMATLCESRDHQLGSHVQRVAAMSKAIAQKLMEMSAENVDEHFIELVELAATLHDTGKIAIPDSILNAQRSLTVEEFEIVKTHSVVGYQTLDDASHFVKEIGLLGMAKEIALYHHEHWDGNGYPDGLTGKAIPLPARIVAVADVFDALRAQRPYKPPWPFQRALIKVNEESGSHFDPIVVRAFMEVAADVDSKQIYETFN